MTTAEVPERLFVREADALMMTGLGRTLFLRRVYAGDIPSIKVGRARLYSVEALREWARRQCEMGGDDDAA